MKKIFFLVWVLFATTLLATASPHAVGSSNIGDLAGISLQEEESDTTTTVFGDVNGDGALNIADITLLYNIILGNEQPPEPVTPNKLVLERKYLVHHSGQYCEPSISLDFDNNVSLSVRYFNTLYYHGAYQSEPYQGVHIVFSHDGFDCTNNPADDWFVAPLSLDQWVEEKLIINMESGNVKYYVNGSYKGDFMFNVGSRLSDATTVTVNIYPNGWWTGHYHYMDDFKIVTPVATVSDNFNDGILDPSIWRTPANPDGVREEDGILKTKQYATDYDCSLHSVVIPLRQ